MEKLTTMESDRRLGLNLDLKVERCRKQAIPIFTRNLRPQMVNYANEMHIFDDANQVSVTHLVAYLLISHWNIR